MMKRFNRPKDIVHFFRHQLKDYEAESPDFLWEKLEKRIPAKPKKKVPWLLMGILAFCTGLILFAITWNWPTNRQKIQETTTSPSSIIALQPTLPPPTKPIFGTKLIKESKDINEAKSDQVSTLNNNTKSKKRLLPLPFNNKQTSKQTPKKISNKMVSGLTKIKNKLLEKRSKEGQLNVNQNIYLSKTNDNVSSSMLLLPLTKSSFELLVPSIKRDTLPKLKKISKGQFLLGKWYAELVTAPYLWFAGKAKNTTLKLNQSLINGNKLVDYGILLKGEGQQKWSFEFGFLHGVYRFESPINNSLQFSYLNNFLDEEDHLIGKYSLETKNLWQPSTAVEIKYANLAPPFIQDGETFDLKGTLTQQLRNLRFPFGIGYQLSNRDRWITSINAGFSFNHFTLKSTSFAQVQISHESLEFKNINSSDTLNSNSFQTIDSYFSLNINYQLSNATKLRLGTQFSTSLFSTTYNNNTLSLKGVQLSIGLNYRIGHTHSNYQIK